MHFVDLIAELTERFRANLERGDVEWRSPTEADLAKAAADHAKLIAWLRSPAASAPREKSYPTDADIERWIVETGIPAEALFDSIAMYLARGFDAGSLPFGFCDGIMNDLNVFTLRRDSPYATYAKNGPLQGPPKLFWSIFLAFDAGEYGHPGDDRDPRTFYTRPAIAKIIAENPSFHYPDSSLPD